MGLISAGVLSAAGVTPAEASAQTVLVRVVGAEFSRPVFGALAYLVDDSDHVAKSTLTDELGRGLFVGVAAGSYRVRVEMIGMATAETDLFDLAAGATLTRDLMMESSAIVLEGIDVEMEGRCRVRPGGEGLLVADVWDEARKALSAASFTDQRDMYRYQTVRYERQLDINTGAVLTQEQRRRDGYMRTPFESRPAEDLVENGFVQMDGRDYVYYAPDATALLSDAFLDTHCFRLKESRNDQGLLGLGFEPTGEDSGEPDIEGVMWLDPATAELRWLEYRYTYLEPEMSSSRVGGRVDFRRMPDGSWIVPEWWIRMPIMAEGSDFEGNRHLYIARYHQTGGMVLGVREAGGRGLGRMAQTGGIEGVVRDSVGLPLRGVRVGVVGSNQEVYSNAEGAFSITGLTEGRYQVRFVDARLEIMGFVPEPIERDVIRGEMSYMEYVTPSVGDVLFQACRGVERDPGTVLLAGIVVDVLGQPVPDAVVQVTWSGFKVSPSLTEQTNGFQTTTTTKGFFRFCGVPPNTRLRVTATLGERASDEQEVLIHDYETGRITVVELRND